MIKEEMYKLKQAIMYSMDCYQDKMKQGIPIDNCLIDTYRRGIDLIKNEDLFYVIDCDMEKVIYVTNNENHAITFFKALIKELNAGYNNIFSQLLQE